MTDHETKTTQFATTCLHEAVAHVLIGGVLTDKVKVVCDTPEEAAILVMELRKVDAFDLIDPSKVEITVASTGITKTIDEALCEMAEAMLGVSAMLAMLLEPKGTA